MKEFPFNQEHGKQKESTGNWTDNPSLKGIDAQKLALLNSLAQQGKGKTPQELLPFLMSAASQNRSKGLSFSSQEMDAIIRVLKIGKSQEELQRIEQLLSMMKMMR